MVVPAGREYELAKKYGAADANGRISDPELRMKLAAHDIDSRAHNLTLMRAAAEARGANGATNAASVLKNSDRTTAGACV